MSNLFLKVNKDLFKLGLNPTELLILAQIMEFDTNNKTCYMTNEQFAKELNVSEKTVQRALNDTLEDKGYITIINPRSKNRSFQLNKSVIEDKLGQIDQDKEHGQNVQDNMDKMSNQHGQFDPIKDNKKINIKDKETIEPPRGKVEAVREVMKDSTSSNGEFKF
jgi:DNA-binding transcriptional regulator YhcF (GntR family)